MTRDTKEPAVDVHVEAAPPDARQCGRCRKLFDGDPTMPAGVIAGWWLCDPCRVSLRIDG